MKKKQKIRLYELDALRGIAAISVVIYHYFFRYNEIYTHEKLLVTWSHWGEFGVQLFFMISGFVIYWTLNRVKSPMDFIVSRFSRLYPVFWGALSITFIVVILFGLPGREVKFEHAILNLLMIHEYLRIPHVDGVYWTLTVELTFYFAIFIFYLFKQLRYVEVWLSISVIIGVFKGLGYEIPGIVSKMFIADYMAFFIAGICFYKIQYEEFSKLTFSVLLISLFSSIAIFSPSMFIFFTIMYLVFYLSISSRLQFLATKPFIFLGGISYALYLTHQNIGYIIINLFYEHGVNPLLGIATAFLISILIAYLLTKFIEKPSMLFIRNAYEDIKRRKRERFA